MNQFLTYDKIILPEPRLSVVRSRSECDTSVNFLGHKFKLPVVPANMPSVVDFDICEFLARNGYFYILHRYYKQGDILAWIKKNQDTLISISVGVKQEDKDFIMDLKGQDLKVDFITIDIACGHSVICKEMIEFIKLIYPGTKVIAGNICTLKAARDYQVWGADAAKVGIAQGSACSTYNHTGFMSPMFSLAIEVGQSPLPVILDGGIRSNGDITKALIGYRSNFNPFYYNPRYFPDYQVMVMAGSLFAACEDAPSENIYEPTKYTFTEFGPAKVSGSSRIVSKHYYGNASKTNKQNSGQETKHIEGFDVELPCNGMSFKEKLEEIQQDLQSSISYAGGKDLSALNGVKWGTI